MTSESDVLALIETFARANEIEYEPGASDDELVVSLPGEKKLKTVVSLKVSDGDMSLSAFVIRHPDENHEKFYRFLLGSNLRLPHLAYATDSHGDVYLVGRTPVAGFDEQTFEGFLDALLGEVLAASDAVFNDLLILGFRSSMQKEWDWRVSRGESLRNLEAFRHLLEPSTSSTPPAQN